MCGRYTLHKTGSDIAKRYNLATVPKGIHINYKVVPTQTMPVIRDTGKGWALELMRWGIPRFIGPGKVKDVFNTRSDKAFGSWKNLVMNTRCLVPASGYFEWKKLTEDGKEVKQPYYFHPKQIDLFSFAGVWNLWRNKESEEEIKVYSIITTEPNKEAASVHNRMPVILHQDDESSWLSPSHNNDRGAIEALLRPYEDNGLEMFEASRDVNAGRINDERLIYPLNSQ